MLKRRKKLDHEIIKTVEKCIKICKTKLELARYLGVEWTTVDRWKEGLFKPSIENYIKLQKLAEKGRRDDK